MLHLGVAFIDGGKRTVAAVYRRACLVSAEDVQNRRPRWDCNRRIDFRCTRAEVRMLALQPRLIRLTGAVVTSCDNRPCPLACSSIVQSLSID